MNDIPHTLWYPWEAAMTGAGLLLVAIPSYLRNVWAECFHIIVILFLTIATKVKYFSSDVIPLKSVDYAYFPEMNSKLLRKSFFIIKLMYTIVFTSLFISIQLPCKNILKTYLNIPEWINHKFFTIEMILN